MRGRAASGQAGALAAQVGGIGIAPGGNINYVSGHAIFEATHGSAPKYKGQNKVNPTALILSGKLMLDHLGEKAAAEKLAAAQALGEKLAGTTLKLTQKAGVDGRLFGSVTNHDVANALVKQSAHRERLIANKLRR